MNEREIVNSLVVRPAGTLDRWLTDRQLDRAGAGRKSSEPVFP